MSMVMWNLWAWLRSCVSRPYIQVESDDEDEVDILGEGVI